jgi:heptosyltransferase-1
VIPLALRRWRKQFWRAETRQEWREWKAGLRAETYDAVIDLQGLLKSAWVARLARGPLSGWNAKAARESAAALFYRYRYPGEPIRAVPAVQRYRRLAAAVLDYAPEGMPSYGLRAEATPELKRQIGAPYVVVLTATARPEKRWDQTRWVEVVQALAATSRTVLLAWGNPAERQAAERLVGRIDPKVRSRMTVQPEAWSLGQWMPILAGADAVVGVDTGLLFLAAAVGTPCVGIYVATSPTHVGIHAEGPHRNLGDIGRPPTALEVIDALIALTRPA